jgi:hypothetical protein
MGSAPASAPLGSPLDEPSTDIAYPQLAQINFLSIPFAEGKSTRNLHVLWPHIHGCVELVRRNFGDFSIPAAARLALITFQPM